MKGIMDRRILRKGIQPININIMEVTSIEVKVKNVSGLPCINIRYVASCLF